MRFLAKVATLSVLAATPAMAQTGTFKFLQGSSVYAWGVSVGTYKGVLNGKNVDIWCVDFVNHISAGNQFTVNVTGLGVGANLGNTRFGQLGNQPNVYRQAAWLASQFKTQATSEWGYIHAAIWSLTSGFGSNFTGANLTKLNYWRTQASTNYTKYYYNNAYILTDVALNRCQAANPTGMPWNGCGKQEQIYIDGGLTPVPEPATMGLLATGLVAMTGAGWMRRRRQQQQ